ncbi:MAG TPA: cupredoxin family copper-binding protein [Chthoniobacterales bacterium]|nr:cupredoxin family copper-binding protein [Chthoniobacterales bacterium]
MLQPEYIHVLINPLPVYGLAAGLIGLVVAILQRSRRATIAALVIVLISSASAWPVYELGQQAYDRVLSMADNDGRAWLAEHADRAHKLIWFFYALATLSAVGLVLPIRWPRSSTWFATIVLVLGAACLGLGGYISYAGGRVRHREFRLEPPPNALPNPTARETQPPGSADVAAASQVTIEMVKYSPAAIEIKTGETVVWINNDLTPHTVTSEAGAELNSESIEPGSSWNHKFTQAGIFSYYCTFHTEMKGTVTVN